MTAQRRLARYVKERTVAPNDFAEYAPSLASSGGLFSRADPREGGPALDIERGKLRKPFTVIKVGLSSLEPQIHSNEQVREGRPAIYSEKRSSNRPRL